MSGTQEKVVAQVNVQTADDNDEPDEWDQRIDRTGCADENAKLTDCYYERKDWRACTAEMATPLQASRLLVTGSPSPFMRRLPRPARSIHPAPSASYSTSLLPSALSAPSPSAYPKSCLRNGTKRISKFQPAGRHTVSFARTATTIRSPPSKAAEASPSSSTTSATLTNNSVPEESTYIDSPLGSPYASEWEVDWSTSFHGIGSGPFAPEVTEILRRPIKTADVEIKPDGILYLPEIKYRNILFDAFGPGGWGMVPRGPAQVGEKVITREWALIVHGRFVSQAQGENNYFSKEQIPRAVEACKSNALMRCCKDLGIASELWDKTYIRSYKAAHAEEVWVEHVVTKRKIKIWIKKGEKIEYPFKKASSVAAAKSA
ncbi:hypothetical protein jhhlp_002746 [Lomentospora prolificans]|uniref:Mitochondrial genome maintenance protein MGM101 n=1 Tax=Lomentospora prolificans TaxID=41688 RepID=A0A2N3NF18_9PEZI|nr:hypothetical protein jhhlp_002746 [Lomentospora prolificans]